MAQTRLHMLDITRGGLICLVVLHHLFYSYYFVFSGAIDLYTPALPVTSVLVCLFFLMSGISCHLSRNNTRRGIKTLLFAGVISLVSFLMGPRLFIAFGVLHCLGACMLLYGLLRGKSDRLFGKATGFVWLALFLLCRFFVGGAVSFPGFFWLGFYREGFFSADYYPLLPWVFMFFLGGSLAKFVLSGGMPRWFYAARCRLLERIGRHTLIIYLLHQPAIFLLLHVGLGLARGTPLWPIVL